MKFICMAMAAILIFSWLTFAKIASGQTVLQSNCITTPGSIAAVFEEDLDEAIFYAKNRRYYELERMILSKRAIILAPGNIVNVELESDDKTKIFIRSEGDDVGVWTVRDAVRCKVK